MIPQSELTPHMRRRLEAIDLALAYTGRVNRAVLMNQFDIGVATASRTLKQYRTLHPENVTYSVSDRSYVVSEQFAPVFEHDAGRALQVLAYGLTTQEVHGPRYGVQKPSQLAAALSPRRVSCITRAMVSRSAVRIGYSSATSGISKRVVAPHSLLEAGGVWYFRCFDYKSSEFRTFRFSRVTAAATAVMTEVLDRASDREWNTEVVLTVSPHPQRANQEALRQDLGLTDKPVKNLTVSAAVAGFVLTDMRVDCSPQGTLSPYEYPLRILNLYELSDVGSMTFSPGYRA